MWKKDMETGHCLDPLNTSYILESVNFTPFKKTDNSSKK